MSGVHVTVTDKELEMILYFRAFETWYAGLSEPAKDHLDSLPDDTILALVRSTVMYRLEHDLIDSIGVSSPILVQQFPLRFAA